MNITKRIKSCERTEFDGFVVDLSQVDTYEILRKIEYRMVVINDTKRIEVYYKNKWLRLSRTDLSDNVCTAGMDIDEDKLYESVCDYAKRARYGARITDKLFAVVDSFSDG